LGGFVEVAVPGLVSGLVQWVVFPMNHVEYNFLVVVVMLLLVAGPMCLLVVVVVYPMGWTVVFVVVPDPSLG
jgi:hypothetical protein